MKATPEQIEKVYLAMQQLRSSNPLVRQLAKATKEDVGVVKASLKVIRQAEEEHFAAQIRAEKYDTLITFQRAIHEVERGKSKGLVGTCTSDRSPTPSGMPLLPFLGVLFEKRTFTSHTLPAAQWTEPDR